MLQGFLDRSHLSYIGGAGIAGRDGNLNGRVMVDVDAATAFFIAAYEAVGPSLNVDVDVCQLL